MTSGSGGGGNGGGAVAYVLGMGYNSRAAAGFALGEICAFISGFAAAHKAARSAALCAPRKEALPDCLPLLAARLGAELLLFDKAELQAQSSFCLTHSPRPRELYGCGSVAEAAALCGAAELGSGGLLCEPRHKFGNFTVAIAKVN